MQVYKILPLEVYQKFMQNEDTVEENINIDVSTIVSMLKPKQRTRGEAILTLLARNKNFSWNERFEIIFKGQTIEQSHILDLVSFATKTYPTKRVNITGLDVFIEAIKEFNIPRDLLSLQINNLIDDGKVQVKSRNDKWIHFKYK